MANLGFDQCPDNYEDGADGCLSEGDNLVYDEVTNPDPNGDNYDEEVNPMGTRAMDFTMVTEPMMWVRSLWIRIAMESGMKESLF